MTITQTIHQTCGTRTIGTRTFRNQLDADLATGVRGGNKARLIARIWWGMYGGFDTDGYEAFRAAQIKRTFAQLHADFDQHLDARYRWSTNTSEPQQATPARAHSVKAAKLQASFLRTPDLTPAQRAWITAQGGVLALDGRRMQVAVRGAVRTFTVLDSSWFVTAQAIAKLMDGRAVLV